MIFKEYNENEVEKSFRCSSSNQWVQSDKRRINHIYMYILSALYWTLYLKKYTNNETNNNEDSTFEHNLLLNIKKKYIQNKYDISRDSGGS